MSESIFDLWTDALVGIKIQHLNPECEVFIEVLDGNPPSLAMTVAPCIDTVTGKKIDSLNISTVRLCYFPGMQLARIWLAAAWAGYQQHEALELVTWNGKRVIDPHSGVEYDRGLRAGLPKDLSPESFLESLLAVMPALVVDELYARYAGVE